jgi:hypothetical protein
MSVLSAFALRATADGPPLAIPPVADGPPGAISAMADSRSSQRERRLERETGIEPATNSLEGCDSTTELLPPARRSLPAALRRASPPLSAIPRLRATGEPAFNPITRPACRRPSPDLAQSLQHALTAEPASAILVLGDPCSNPNLTGGQRACQPKLATDSASPFGLWRSAFACVSERRLVAREGLEPSKPLGRQIYSLLRLTAPQPRQLSVWSLRLRRLPWLCCCRQGRQRVRTHPMELAKGFEPPTG